MVSKRKPAKRRGRAKKPAATPVAAAAPVVVKSREQLMDEAAAKTFREMDAVNQDKTIEHRIMTERDIMNPLGPVPSARNAAPGVVNLFDLTFSQAGATDPRLANSAYMQARRRPGRV
jgi:hypothetical protein